MSAGPFVDTTYQTDQALNFVIRVQPETQAIWPTPVVGPVDVNAHVLVGRSTRSFGIHARIVRCKWVSGAPAGYDPNGTLTLPIANPADFPAFVTGYQFAYLGGIVRITGTRPEKLR